MENKKVDVCIVYSPQEGPPGMVYENDHGRIWRSNHKLENMNNIGMGWYSIPNPQPEDSLLVIEPVCILDRDYSVDFAGQFKKIFTWANKAFENTDIINKVVEINHPSVGDLPDPKTIRDSWIPWEEKSHEIVFIANHKMSPHPSQLYTFRLDLADALVRHSDFKVSWYGQIPIPRSYYCGKVDSKNDILKRAKFSVCTENSYHPVYTNNYFTEKMPEAWLAGTIPIYIGCHNIDDFNLPKYEHAYIDLRPYINHQIQQSIFIELFDHMALIDRLKNYTKEYYDTAMDDLVNNINKPDGLYHAISFKRMFDTMINAFYQE